MYVSVTVPVRPGWSWLSRVYLFWFFCGTNACNSSFVHIRPLPHPHSTTFAPIQPARSHFTART